MNILFTIHFWHQLLCAIIVLILFCISVAFLMAVAVGIVWLCARLWNLIPKRNYSIEEYWAISKRRQKIADIIAITMVGCLLILIFGILITQALWPAAGWFCERVL